MKSAVETLNPTRVKLTVEVPFEELKPSLDAAYATIGSQIQVPGFRKGKVPSRIIDQRVGRGAVLQEAVNEALPQFYGQAVEENKVRPIGQPEVDVTDVPAEDGQDLKFTVEVDVRPEVDLPDDFSGITVEVDEAKASDEDVEARLIALQERFGTLKGVERAVANGDFVSIDLRASIGDDEIDSVTGVSYEVGSGNMLDGLDEALTGMAAEETKEFTAPLAGGDREGEDADVVVTVQSVKVRELPALDDDFAQLASEFDTLKELREDVTKQADQAAKFEQGVQARDKVLEHLLETIEIPVPDGVVEAEVNSAPRGREPPRGRRAPRRGRRQHPQGAQGPVPARRDRREDRGQGRAARADRVPRHVGPAVRHGPQPVRPGDRPAGPGARDGRRGGPPQGARRGARAGQGRRHRRPAGRPQRGHRDRRRLAAVRGWGGRPRGSRPR